MAKRAINYEKLAWTDREAESVQPAESAASTEIAPAPDSNLLRDMAHQTMLYLNFEAVRAIDELALAQSRLHHKVKRHDIIVDAIQEYLGRRGINIEVRAKPRGRNRNDG
jgi:hypothetical protein